jgi:hypothetical protein
MFKGKPTRIVITGSAKETFDDLNEHVNDERKKGIGSSEYQTLLNSIKQKIELLRENPEYGIHIQKNRIPREYVRNYETNNLWKVNLSGAWRMIYTIRGSEVEILCVIIDVLNHREYEKKFKYKKA